MEQPEKAPGLASDTALAGGKAPTVMSATSPVQNGASQPPNASCPSCGNAALSGNGMRAPSFVYALGRVEPRFPRISVEKEFAQLAGKAATSGLTDRQAVHEVLSDRRSRYLVRQLCWVMTIEGLDSYILQPRDPADFELLLEAVRPAPRPTDVDIVIGVRGPMAPPDVCNGLMLPIVAFDQIYSFDVDSLIKSMPRPESVPPDQFASAAEEVFMRILQLADNTGATDEHRALNYLAVRYPAIYARTAEAHRADASLSAVDVLPSRLSGTAGKILDVVFSFTNRQTDVTEKFFVRVNVTEEFPFLVTKLSPYYDR
jgi:hypothetical protein